MSEMIETVAKAIGTELWGAEIYDRSAAGDATLSKSTRLIADECRGAARAAIAAMREPTEAMCDASLGDWPESQLSRFGAMEDLHPRDVWQIMIDEALK